MDAGPIFVVMEDDKNPLGMDAGLILAVREVGKKHDRHARESGHPFSLHGSPRAGMPEAKIKMDSRFRGDDGGE